MPGQKPNLKTMLWEPLAQEAWTLGDKLVRRVFGAAEGWEKRRDIVKNNYDLGVRYLKDGYVGDAMFRFKLVTWLDPSHAEGWYGLGAAYVAGGKQAAAEKALKKTLEIKPDYPEASQLLATLEGNAAQ